MVYVFKQQFSVFKQHFTYFNALFHPQVFSQMFLNNNFQFLNTHTKRSLSCHNFFFFLPFSAMPLPQLVSISGNAGRTRISIISLPKFNSLSPLTLCIFSCNFDNTVTEIQSLSSLCQITLNSIYNNNKLRFLQFLAKRLKN